MLCTIFDTFSVIFIENKGLWDQSLGRGSQHLSQGRGLPAPICEHLKQPPTLSSSLPLSSYPAVSPESTTWAYYLRLFSRRHRHVCLCMEPGLICLKGLVPALALACRGVIEGFSRVALMSPQRMGNIASCPGSWDWCHVQGFVKPEQTAQWSSAQGRSHSPSFQYIYRLSYGEELFG